MATPAPTRRLPRAERRASILVGAAHAFAGAGFTTTSMADVAHASGVTPLIVYRHFGSKEELYRAVLADVSEALRERLTETPDPGGYGLGAGSLLAVARANPDGFRLLWRHAIREPQFASEADALRTEALGAAAAALDGLVAPEFLDWASHAVLGYLVEAVLAWLYHGDPARSDRLIAATS
jgi:AcrR family transcriptional regulator